jgi:hypothetical protein
MFMKKMLKKRGFIRISKWIFIGLVLLVILLIGFLQYKTYRPMDEAMLAINKENVIEKDNLIIFEPEGEAIANLVFYQGGLVKTEAYAVLGQLLAEKGIRVYLPKMFLNLAITNIDVFDKVREKNNNELDWYIGGHSLGGASASIYVAKNPENVTGIFFLGSYPSNKSDLSQHQLAVVSINATNDQIINVENFQRTKRLLPDDTVFLEIVGGNHSNFGYYGLQAGDGVSAISREEQHDTVANALFEMIMKSKQN